MDPMNCNQATTTSHMPSSSPDFNMASQPPQLALLDFFFPGFSMLAGLIQKSLKIDLNVFIPIILLFSGLILFVRYFSEYFWFQLESHFMSTVDIRTDDEIYNMLMAWVATQSFAKGARRFVVNTNLNSRSWFLWRWEYEDDDEEGTEEVNGGRQTKKKALSYTPTFGSHYFFYKGRLLIFRRSQNRDQQSYFLVSEREEISVSCFGRNPWVLKELLLEARALFMERDEEKTLIYRGTIKAGSTEPTWQRCMARTSRPFSTIILNDKVKQDLIDDVSDYLNPATRRWYSNRGIPYRRGYLLYGPPGTGKSSLSLALAGFFKMRIYIVSLSSITLNEENLASLFAELPRRCVVLLEDIDTAGLTHTREEKEAGDNSSQNSTDDIVPGQLTRGNGTGNNNNNNHTGRLSLSGLLNILDGVASQEGRVLIMTTNHLEKLDKALIRPGRVDMVVEFGLADSGMIAAIFRAIFAPLEGDEVSPVKDEKSAALDPELLEARLAEEKARRDEIVARVEQLAEQFAAKLPAHEFSPAELQGYLMKNKRKPEAAVAGLFSWIQATRKEKEIKYAEDKRQAEENKKERKQRKSGRDKSKDDSNGSGSDSSDESPDIESEVEKNVGFKKAARKDSEVVKVAPTAPAEKSDELVKQTADDPVASPDKIVDLKVKDVGEDRPRTSDSGYGTPCESNFVP